MQWLTLHVVSANIVRCKRRTKANFAYQPFSAQVTNMLISPGDMIVQQSPGLVTIRQSQDLQMAAAGVREQVVFLVFEIFFPTQVQTIQKWEAKTETDINQESCLHSLNTWKGFENWQKQWFYPPSFQHRQNDTLTSNESCKWFSFLSSAEKHQSTRWQKLRGLTTAIVLNGCQHRHAVFAGSSGFL